MNLKEVRGSSPDKAIESKRSICRTCLLEHNILTSLFVMDFSLHATYCDIISSVTGLEIRPEVDLPTSICPLCMRDATIAYRYKLQAIRAEETLRGASNNIKPEEEFKSPENCVDDEKDIKACLTVERKPNCIDDESKKEREKGETESVLKVKKFDKDIYRSGGNQVYSTFVKMELNDHHDYCDDYSCDDIEIDESVHLSSFSSNRTYDEELTEVDLKEEKNVLYQPSQIGVSMSEQCEVSSAPFKNVSILQPRSLNCMKAEDVKEKKNYCPMCGENFDTAVELVRHARSHDRLMTNSGLNAYATHSRDTSQPSDVNGAPAVKRKKKKHSKTINKSSTPVKKYQMEKIKLKNVALEQAEMEKVRMNGEDLERGEEIQNVQSVPNYPHCGICSLKFKTHKKLENHFRAHSNTTVIMCPLCDKFFLEYMYFKRHLLNGHDGKDDYLVLSESVVKTTNMNSLMASRMETFPDTSLYLALCQRCGQLTLSAKELMDHNSQEHPHFNYKNSRFGKLINDQNSAASVPIEPKRPHKCTICENSFRLAAHLISHIKNKHNLMKDDQHECYICSKKFKKFDKLDKHKYRSHRVQPADGKRFHCNHCDYKCFEKWNLACHLRVHSTYKGKKTTVVCQYCGRNIVKKDMAAHIRRVHTGERPYKCQYCDKAFVRGGERVEHERIHTGYKPYECDVCGIRSTKSLSVHKRIHTGERPHKCSYCGQSFTQKGDMRAHERRHTGESAHACKCGKTFTRAKYLNEHKKACPDK